MQSNHAFPAKHRSQDLNGVSLFSLHPFLLNRGASLPLTLLVLFHQAIIYPCQRWIQSLSQGWDCPICLCQVGTSKARRDFPSPRNPGNSQDRQWPSFQRRRVWKLHVHFWGKWRSLTFHGYTEQNHSCISYWQCCLLPTFHFSTKVPHMPPPNSPFGHKMKTGLPDPPFPNPWPNLVHYCIVENDRISKYKVSSYAYAKQHT